MFQDMIGAIEFDVTRTMMKAQIHEQARENGMNVFRQQQQAISRPTKQMLMVRKLTLVKWVVMTSVHVVQVRNLKIVTDVNNFSEKEWVIIWFLKQ